MLVHRFVWGPRTETKKVQTNKQKRIRQQRSSTRVAPFWLPDSFASFLLLLWCLFACGPRGGGFLLSGRDHVAGRGSRWSGCRPWSGGVGGAWCCLTGIPGKDKEPKPHQRQFSRKRNILDPRANPALKPVNEPICEVWKTFPMCVSVPCQDLKEPFWEVSPRKCDERSQLPSGSSSHMKAQYESLFSTMSNCLFTANYGFNVLF